MIFNQQQMSPTFLYLGNPVELSDGVGDIFARKISCISVTLLAKLCRTRISKPFFNRNKFKIFKIIDFLSTADVTYILVSR